MWTTRAEAGRTRRPLLGAGRPHGAAPGPALVLRPGETGPGCKKPLAGRFVGRGRVLLPEEWGVCGLRRGPCTGT